MSRRLLLGAASVLIATGVAAHATAAPLIQGTVTCDNEHRLFSGSANGVIMTARGAASVGFTTGVTYGFTLPCAEDFLYLAAWSDDFIQQGLVHDITVDGVPFPSCQNGSTAWEVCATGQDRDIGSPVSVGNMQAAVASCNAGATPSGGWVTPVCGGLNNGTFPPSSPWCSSAGCAGISTQSQWTWYDSGNQTSGSPVPFRPGFYHDEFLIFRLPVPTIYSHLKCYKIKKDHLKFNAIVDLDSPQFGIESGCEVKKAEEFCVPVCKTVLASENTNLNGFDGQDLLDDRICYKVQCPTSLAPPQLGVQDQFGDRILDLKKATLICTPARKLCRQTGIHQCGGACVDPNEECLIAPDDSECECRPKPTPTATPTPTPTPTLTPTPTFTVPQPTPTACFASCNAGPNAGQPCTTPSECPAGACVGPPACCCALNGTSACTGNFDCPNPNDFCMCP